MCKIIQFPKVMRRGNTPNTPRRPASHQGASGLVSIGVISAELVRRIRRE